MIQQVERMAHACAYEVWALIQRGSSTNLFTLPMFKAALGKLSKEHRKGWKALVKSSADASDTRTVLDEVRNKLSFHYQFRKTLADGYRVHFVTDPKNDHNEKAMFSIGHNMEGCRFYFADAAAGGAVREAIAKAAKTAKPGSRPFGDNMKDIFNTMTESVVHLIAAYLYLKMKSAETPEKR